MSNSILPSDPEKEPTWVQGDYTVTVYAPSHVKVTMRQSDTYTVIYPEFNIGKFGIFSTNLYCENNHYDTQ